MHHQKLCLCLLQMLYNLEVQIMLLRNNRIHNLPKKGNGIR